MSASGGAEPTPSGGTPPTTPTGSGNPEGSQPNKSFTQEQVDALIADRLARASKKYEGFDDLRKKAEEFDKLTDAQKSAEERLTGEIAGLKDQLTAAEQRERSYQLRDAIDGVVRGESFGHTLAAPVADVLHFLPADLDAADDRAVAKALTDLTKNKGYLFAEKAKRPGGADPPALTPQAANPGFGLDRLRAGYEAASSRR
jgi:hypothetical protein